MTALNEPWTDFELQCLYDVVTDADWFRYASQLITRRSPGAIRTKMSILRAEARITISAAGAANRARPLPASERASAESGSARLLQRMIEVHAPPRPVERKAAPASPSSAERKEVQLAFFIGPLFDLELAA